MKWPMLLKPHQKLVFFLMMMESFLLLHLQLHDKDAKYKNIPRKNSKEDEKRTKQRIHKNTNKTTKNKAKFYFGSSITIIHNFLHIELFEWRTNEKVKYI